MLPKKLRSNKICVQKNFGSKKFWIQKNFGYEKDLALKNVSKRMAKPTFKVWYKLRDIPDVYKCRQNKC